MMEQTYQCWLSLAACSGQTPWCFCLSQDHHYLHGCSYLTHQCSIFGQNLINWFHYFHMFLSCQVAFLIRFTLILMTSLFDYSSRRACFDGNFQTVEFAWRSSFLSARSEPLCHLWACVQASPRSCHGSSPSCFGRWSMNNPSGSSADFPYPQICFAISYPFCHHLASQGSKRSNSCYQMISLYSFSSASS